LQDQWLSMNIEVNATLIVQIINFWIAYHLFRVILLKPAYSAICRDQETKLLLTDLITQHHQLLDQQRAALAAQWQDTHRFFKEHTPGIVDIPSIVHEPLPPLQPVPLDPKTVHAVQDQITHLIVTELQGAPHDYP
jgi:hypothetical protein